MEPTLHAKIERGVVPGYGAPVAQNPAYSPPQPGGGEPPRRPVVVALARPARARAERRRDLRVTQNQQKISKKSTRPVWQTCPAFGT
jgi:hypothetical protein